VVDSILNWLNGNHMTINFRCLLGLAEVCVLLSHYSSVQLKHTVRFTKITHAHMVLLFQYCLHFIMRITYVM